MLRASFSLSLTLLVAACATSSNSDQGFGNGEIGGAAGTGGSAAGSAGTSGTAGAGGVGGAGGTGLTGGSAGSSGGISGASGSGAGGSAGGIPTCQPDMVEAEVFAHGAITLYRIDPNTLQLTTVGGLDCGASVIDIALDQHGQMFGTTYTSLVKIDKTTGACTTVTSGTFPNSLSFVPAGTVHPDKEALVGYNGATYIEIDPDTGSITELGSLGDSTLQSSGDIVSVIGGATYLTVKGGSCADCLVKVDPKTGAIQQNLGDIGYGSVFGLAFWGGVVYGFTKSGEVFSYDIVSHATALVPVNGATSYYGAGSSTCAPPDKIQ